MTQNVIVLGAGAVGSSVAAGLAERGARVTLLDREAPGAGTSGTSFAWVNANGKEPAAYFEINRLGVEAHRRLAGDGLSWLGAGGHVEIAVDADHQEDLHRRVATLRDRDYGAELITPARAARLLPGVRVPAAAGTVAHFPREGYAFPALYLAHALDRVRAAGGRLLTGADVVGLEPAGGGAEVVLADGRRLRADAVVSATGRWTPAVAALAGVELPMQRYSAPGDATVGYLLETSPVPVRLDHVVTTPLLNLRPAGGGRLQLQALDLDASADPARPPADDPVLLATVLQRLRDVVVGAEGARVASAVVGRRSLPADGRTVAGPSLLAPWLYLVATHSGITLAPFLGEAVADEVRGRERPELAAFRPARFAAGSSPAGTAAPRRPGQQ